MNELSKYLVESILSEEKINDYVVVYAGRFQPFHKGHFATYKHLVSKFGKDNVFIGTSDKTDKLKSPFNFKEKKEVMTKMFGVPSNRIVQIKNPYAPTEILNKFNEDTTAFITVVGEKDASRLGGKYFEKYKGKVEQGYKDKGYVYVSPSQPNPISGTDVRNWLGSGSTEERQKLFTKAYPKFDKKIFDLITKKLDSLNERIFIPKEVIEEYISQNFDTLLKEVTINTAGSDSTNKVTDDGPNFFFPNFNTFDKISQKRAEDIGYTVFKQIMSGELEDYYEHPIYPKGPVKAVTPFPAGVIGKTTATNQKDFEDIRAYSMWFRHIKRVAGATGWDLVRNQSELETRILSLRGLKALGKQGRKESKPSLEESIIKEDTIKLFQKSLGIDREDMPQIKKKDMGDYLNFLKGRKVAVAPYTIPVSKIGMTQKNVNLDIVDDLIKGDIQSLLKPIILSKDDYVMDGHHRIVALYNINPQTKLKGIKVDLPIKELLEVTSEFPKVSYKGIEEYASIFQPHIRAAAKQLGLGQKDDEKGINEDINIPVNIGDTILTGRFKNKAVVVKSIGKDEHGMPTINGKKVVSFRMMKEGYVFEFEEKDYGKQPYVVDLEDLTTDNDNFRTTKWTGKDLQMTLMSIEDEIGLERHDQGDQFIRVEEGEGKVVMGLDKDNMEFEAEIEDDYAIFIPEGYWHNIINTGNTPLKVYAIYAPPQHKSGTVNPTKPMSELMIGYPDEKWMKQHAQRLKRIRKDLNKQHKDVYGEGSINEIPMADLVKIDQYADKQLNPVDVVLTDKHFFDRLQDPRNQKDISAAELIGFFKRLAKNKNKFVEFLNQYGQIVAKDNRSKINIPFMKQANKVIAKTIMRKDDFKTSSPEYKFESILNEGGAYGHMNHPFDIDVNLTFGQLKDIVKKALTGNLSLTREKTDGQALAVSWRDGRLIAARNKGHLKNRGENALDIQGIAQKFAGRGGLTDAYNFAMKDLNVAISKLSNAQKEKIFGNGKSFMNIEVIWPQSVNVVPYGQPLLVFHGTMEYDESGTAIGQNQGAARILAGMIKQVNQDVQSKYTIQGPPVTKLPKNQELTKLQPKYLGMINKLQSEFGLKDNQGVAEYHQAWWKQFIEKNQQNIDEQEKIGLIKRWAFLDKSFRINTIGDEKIRTWAEKIDKQDQGKISKDNLMKFERIFLGVGSDVLQFMSSVLTVNPDKAKRAMVSRLEQTIKDVEAKGTEKQVEKLKLELKRLQDLGGFDKIVPNEGIVFEFNGYTMKLTGAFAPLNQILGIFF